MCRHLMGTGETVCFNTLSLTCFHGPILFKSTVHLLCRIWYIKKPLALNIGVPMLLL